MRKSTKWILAGAGAVLLAGGAFASNAMQRHGYGERQRIGEEMFAAADIDGDGAVSTEEMLAALDGRFRSADVDANSAVSKAEAVSAVESIMPGKMARRWSGSIADRAIYRLDIDNDGLVQFGEVTNRAKKLFALVDWNDDGKVEKSEIERLRMGGGHRGWRGHRRGWRSGDE